MPETSGTGGIIQQNGTTTSPANDLQINIEEISTTEHQNTHGNNENFSNENFDLSINLPEISNNDDRLKEEDQKNQQNETVQIATNKISTIESSATEISTTKTSQETSTEKTETNPLIQESIIQPNQKIETPHNKEQQISETHEENIQPSSKIEEIVTEQKENLPQGSNLEKDMAIINELEEHPNAGGLSSEAIVSTTPISTTEPIKTFDLDTMLNATSPTPSTSPTQETIYSKDTSTITSQIQQQNPAIPTHNQTQFEIGNIPSSPTMIPPAFTIPTTQIPASGILQTTIPPKKTTGIKILLFIILFVTLGFTSFFILKTMYPVEFQQILGGNKSTQMHASEATIEETTTEINKENITEENILYEQPEENTGTSEITGTNFGELHELGETNQENQNTQSETGNQTDISRLADYINKGNSLREQGKMINNNTVIKYGLYITKKATDLLEKIAKGEEIINLSGYFAQFDQYITQLEVILNESSFPSISTQQTTGSSTSYPSTNNDLSNMTESTSNTNTLITE